MKLILTFLSGRVVELDEVPVHIAFHGDAQGETVGPVCWDGYAPLTIQGDAENAAITLNGLFDQPAGWENFKPAISVLAGEAAGLEIVGFPEADDCVTVDALQATH